MYVAMVSMSMCGIRNKSDAGRSREENSKAWVPSPKAASGGVLDRRVLNDYQLLWIWGKTRSSRKTSAIGEGPKAEHGDFQADRVEGNCIVLSICLLQELRPNLGGAASSACLLSCILGCHCVPSGHKSSPAPGQELGRRIPAVVDAAFQPISCDREPKYSEIAEGLYVGGWPSSPDHLPPGEPAVIDCTCELPRISALTRNGYLCVATWDTRAPRPSEIESAVRWACRKRAQKKPVYIHCAFGHGRSVCVMYALLVALGIAEDWKAAEKIVKEKRPCIQMNALHRKHLEEWSKHRISFKRNELDVSS
ncbi:hypothetical protein Taro_047539 [Colocasia esculenta]|uniref:Tyrosine specific protein phosphatases domain-containing protein n=1 Tax=Colocasia esculenta TaxID=4460 RepID=A0A843X6R9_COLES|nr:hypothetical protein [Colocasia esculenta]